MYATTLRSYFQGDDFEAISDVVRTGPTLRWLTSVGAGAHVRPVLWANLWLTHRLVGMDPLWWHVGNVVAHAGVAWLVAVVADSLLGDAPQRRLAAVAAPLAGVLFLVSPAHAETVSWIIARVDLITGLCLAASLLAWIRWRRGDPRTRWAVLSFVGFAVALHTKEAVITFPGVLVAHELWHLAPTGQRRASLRRAAVGLAPQVGLLAIYLLRYQRLDPAFFSGEGGELGAAGPLVVVRRTTQVVARSFLPAMPSSAWLVVAAAVLVGAGAVALGWRRWDLGRLVAPHLATFGFLATAQMVLVAPVGRLGVSMDTTAGDRLAYVPSVFAAIAVAMVLGLVAQAAPRVGRALIPAVVVAAALLLVAANGTYVRGGQLMAGVVASQEQWPRDRRVVILVAPDAIGGSWGGRNGLGHALVLLRGWTYPAQYREMASLRLHDVDDTLSVRKGSCDRCVVLRSDDPRARFVSPDPAEVPIVRPGLGGTVLRIDDREVEIELDPAAAPGGYWYLSGGRLVPLGEVPG